MAFHVCGLGRIGRDPEVKEVKDDLVVARFTVATPDKRRPKEGEERHTNWHWVNVLARKDSALLPRIKKGAQVLITEGNARVYTQEKKDDAGNTTPVSYHSIECNASGILVLDKPGNADKAEKEKSEEFFPGKL